MEGVVLQPTATTMKAASRVPVKMDTVEMALTAQVSETKIEIFSHRSRYINMLKAPLAKTELKTEIYESFTPSTSFCALFVQRFVTFLLFFVISTFLSFFTVRC